MKELFQEAKGVLEYMPRYTHQAAFEFRKEEKPVWADNVVWLNIYRGDEKIGAQIILKALEAPLFHIAYNAGLEGAVIINKVRESEVGTGFDAYKEEYVNMIDAGILDPAKVTRSALQNATSVASTLLTTESVVANIKEDAPAVSYTHLTLPTT